MTDPPLDQIHQAVSEMIRQENMCSSDRAAHRLPKYLNNCVSVYINWSWCFADDINLHTNTWSIFLSFLASFWTASMLHFLENALTWGLTSFTAFTALLSDVKQILNKFYEDTVVREFITLFHYLPFGDYTQKYNRYSCMTDPPLWLNWKWNQICNCEIKQERGS
jgi:hypothetical protein